MEGCGYRDLYADFQALGVKIVGVNADDPDELKDWAEEEGFQYELWSDADRVLGQHYGAATSPTTTLYARITKVLDAEGVLVLEYTEDVVVGTHPADVLEDCQQLFGK